MTPLSVSDSFPLEGCTPRLARDGRFLILRGVNVKGKLLDIKIERKDPNGQTILDDLDQAWPLHIIQQAAQVAQQIFSKFPKYKNKVISYKDTDPGSFTVMYQEKDGCSPIQNESVKNLLTEIHGLFFKCRSSGPAMETSLVQAKLVNPSDWLDKMSPDPSSSKSSEEIGEVVSDLENLDEETDESEESSFETPMSSPRGSPQAESAAKPSMPLQKKTQEEIQNETAKKELIQKIDDDLTTEEKNALPEFLKGITYKAFYDYAISKKDPKNKSQKPESKLEQAYNSFKILLKNPNSNDSSAKDMYSWLTFMHKRAYKYYHGSEIHDSLLRFEESSSVDVDLCNEYAARDVVGFIYAEENTDALVERLKSDLYVEDDDI